VEIFPTDKPTIEAIYRVAGSSEGRKLKEHFQTMLTDLDKQSRTLTGDVDLINKGKRQCLADLIRMVDEIPTVMKQRMEPQA
jgi:hypothetical protein